MDIIFAGIDPGLHGAIAFIDKNNVFIHSPPLLTHNNKKDYDIAKMADILKLYQNKHVVICIEAVFAMTAQGVSSSFNFGRGKGIWEGLCYAMGFEVHMITPQKWKKYFNLIQHINKEQKQNLNRFQIAKLKRDIKTQAKVKSRQLASKLYPELAHLFQKVNSDGKAEAVLIATYAKGNYNMLKETTI